MRRLNYTAIFPCLFILAFIGYCLPWVLTPASSLSLGAYDLAEWSSLHPIVRQTTPFLWTALALRIPLAILGILFAAYVNKIFHRKTISITCLVIAAISLLPPLEFFTVFRDDPNYRQQFILALLTLIIGILLMRGKAKKLQIILVIVLSLFGSLSSTIGIYQAQNLMQGFGLQVTIGVGGVIMTAALATAAYLYITKQSS